MNLIRVRIRNNIDNPGCTFCQGRKCVKKSIKFNDFNFYPRGSICSIRPRHKCPAFKPKYPDIWDFIIKNKLIKNEKGK